MRSVKHCTQVLIVGAHCIDWSCKFADSDVTKNFRFRSNFGHGTFQGSYSGFQLRWKSTESGFRHGNIIVPGMFEELLVMSFSAEPNRRRPYDRDLR